MPRRIPRTKAGKKAGMETTMHEYKHGQLMSGSGQPVKSRKQAIAIGLKQTGQSRTSARGKKRGARRS